MNICLFKNVRHHNLKNISFYTILTILNIDNGIKFITLFNRTLTQCLKISCFTELKGFGSLPSVPPSCFYRILVCKYSFSFFQQQVQLPPVPPLLCSNTKYHNNL